jgi:hypothetical protein
MSMAKRRKLSSVKVSARLPAEVWFRVESWAERTGWSEAQVLSLFVQVADTAIDGNAVVSKRVGEQLRAAEKAKGHRDKFEAAEKAGRLALRLAKSAAAGTPAPKVVPAELAS